VVHVLQLDLSCKRPHAKSELSPPLFVPFRCILFR
jgi:hypothetical protein